MSSSMSATGDIDGLSSSSHSSQPTTRAVFTSPGAGNALSSSQSSQKSTVVVHEKSPLLVATPPQITRALAHLYPYLLILNRLVGLLTWTTGDIWESFLLLAGFWAITLYGDTVVRYAGPLVVVFGLVLASYVRRYSSSSLLFESTGNNGDQRMPGKSVSHRRSLDDIVDCVTLFTARCDILLEPFLETTSFLSANLTASSFKSAASTQPALLTLFIRALFLTPIWFLLSVPPLQVVTAKRAVLMVGTTVLTWHSPAAKISRTLLWRSRTVRRICRLLTGLRFSQARKTGVFRKLLSSFRLGSRAGSVADRPSTLIRQKSSVPKTIRFTFTLYENQRRWLGIGWTSSMLAYERPAWTDERLNPKPPKERFRLPQVEGAHAKWRWVEGSEWEIDIGNDERGSKNSEADQGWIYYDNKVCICQALLGHAPLIQHLRLHDDSISSLREGDYELILAQWRNGKRQDGWGKYTRRRKWCRDAELVEITPTSSTSPSSSTTPTQHLSTSSTNPTPSLTPSTPSTNNESSSSPPPYSQIEPSTAASSSSPSATEQQDQREKLHLQPQDGRTPSKGSTNDAESNVKPLANDSLTPGLKSSTNARDKSSSTATHSFGLSPKLRDKKVSTSKFRKSWFGGGGTSSKRDESSGIFKKNNDNNDNNAGKSVSVGSPGSRRRSSGSMNSFGSSRKSDVRSIFGGGGGSGLGSGVGGGDGGGGEGEEVGETEEREGMDGREAVGTPMGTQEELDHYAYGRGLGEDAMMGLG